MRESACSARLIVVIETESGRVERCFAVKDKHRRLWLSVVIAGGVSLVSHAGGALLVEVAGVAGWPSVVSHY
jgi:hypothetical protein